jgi:hypothetical protein
MSRELENEDELWRAYLEANGVSTAHMGESLEVSASESLKKVIAKDVEM